MQGIGQLVRFRADQGRFGQVDGGIQFLFGLEEIHDLFLLLRCLLIVPESIEIIAVPPVVGQIQIEVFPDIGGLLLEELAISAAGLPYDRSFPEPGVFVILGEQNGRMAVLFQGKARNGRGKIGYDPKSLYGIDQVRFAVYAEIIHKLSLIANPVRQFSLCSIAQCPAKR